MQKKLSLKCKNPASEQTGSRLVKEEACLHPLQRRVCAKVRLLDEIFHQGPLCHGSRLKSERPLSAQLLFLAGMNKGRLLTVSIEQVNDR